MDLTPFLAAKGERILRGVTGVVHQGKGTITIAKAAVVGVDWNLMRLLMLVTDELGIAMSLNSLDTGKGIHAPGSRHFSGCAADCDRMGAVGGPLMPATLRNRYAVRYVEFLLAHSFQPGEGGPHPAVLFGPPHSQWNRSGSGHSHHVHTSIYRRALPGASEEGVEEEDTCGEEEEKEGGTPGEGVQQKDNSTYLSAPPVASAARRHLAPGRAPDRLPGLHG